MGVVNSTEVVAAVFEGTVLDLSLVISVVDVSVEFIGASVVVVEVVVVVAVVVVVEVEEVEKMEGVVTLLEVVSGFEVLESISEPRLSEGVTGDFVY